MPGWRVTSQSEATETVAGGRLQRGFRVYFTTAGGTDASVFVPQANYTSDQIAQMIEARATEIDKVGGLTG